MGTKWPKEGPFESSFYEEMQSVIRNKVKENGEKRLHKLEEELDVLE